jgi:hypothetical protein
MASPPDDGDPHELLDQIEAAVDQVLEIAPVGGSVSEYPSVTRPGHRTLTPGRKLMVLHPKVMRLSKGSKKEKAGLSKRERVSRTKDAKLTGSEIVCTSDHRHRRFPTPSKCQSSAK